MFSDSAHREGMPSLEGGGYELINQHGQSTPWQSTSKSTKAWFFGITALYVILLTGDGVVGAILFDVYTEIYSQYLNQATALVYCVWSSLAVWWLKRSRKPMAAADDEVSAPWSALVFIGCLNGSANFFQGTGMPHTSGLSQSLLLVLSLPIVLILSYVFLKKAPTKLSAVGAACILGGTAVSALRGSINSVGSDGGIAIFWYSTLFFALGQIFLGAERVYEDFVFGKYRAADPMTMFCVTMWTQFFLYLVFLPTQTLPAFGGIDLSEIPGVIYDGFLCTIGTSSNHPGRPACDGKNTALFFIYCVVDFLTYFVGLYIISKFGAPTMAVASAIVIPISQIVYCLPFLGKYVEHFYPSDFVALVIVLIGYTVYEWNAKHVEVE
jgi:drug/metabolite transporter (DMT)-like permease